MFISINRKRNWYFIYNGLENLPQGKGGISSAPKSQEIRIVGGSLKGERKVAVQSCQFPI